MKAYDLLTCVTSYISMQFVLLQDPHICFDYFLYFKVIYYIPITDTTLELSVFLPSDTESPINELRFSESISLSFKTRLTSVTCFCGDVTYLNCKHGTRDGKMLT